MTATRRPRGATPKGYKPKRRIFNLNFDDDTDFPGLQITIRGLSTGRLLGLMALAERFTGRDFTAQSNEDGEEDESASFSPEDIRAIKQLFDGFAEALISWNVLDEDNQPVPATLVGVESQDFEFNIPVILAWINTIAGVSEDLGKELTSGPPSRGVSIPMEPLTTSLSN